MDIINSSECQPYPFEGGKSGEAKVHKTESILVINPKNIKMEDDSSSSRSHSLSNDAGSDQNNSSNEDDVIA